MSGETRSAPELEIIRSISADAVSQADGLIAAAQSTAADDMKKAQEEADGIRAAELATARDKAVRIRAQQAAGARIEGRRLLLRAREEAVADVLGRMEQALSALRKDGSVYRRALANLAVEAILGVNEPQVILRVSKLDEALVDAAFTNEVTGRANGRLGHEVTILLEIQESDTGGGCIGASTDGRIVFDNTFHRRLEAMKRELRASIVAELVKKNV